MFGLSPSALSRTLRTDYSSALRRKRQIVALSALGLLDFSLITLYQTGVIKHLPDLPGDLFDSDYVNASEEAYRFGAPDAPLSAVVYGLTVVLATAGGTEKTGRPPAMDLLMGGALLANAGGAANYLVNMITEQKKVCLYCVAGAAINFASLAVAWPDIRDGVRRIFKG